MYINITFRFNFFLIFSLIIILWKNFINGVIFN
jgi:hypothetical protein